MVWNHDWGKMDDINDVVVGWGTQVVSMQSNVSVIPHSNP